MRAKPTGTVRTAAGAAAAVLLAFVLGSPGASAADEEPLTVDTLPSLTDGEISGHIESVEIPDIEAIDVPEIETFEPEIRSSGEETVVSLNTDVLFRFGEAKLTASANDAVVDAVADVPDGVEVTIVGHTDSIGSTSDNQKLSEKRAQAVADAVEAERDDLTLEVTGKGESDPVEPNKSGGKDNPDGREKNRRVEIRYAG